MRSQESALGGTLSTERPGRPGIAPPLAFPRPIGIQGRSCALLIHVRGCSPRRQRAACDPEVVVLLEAGWSERWSLRRSWKEPTLRRLRGQVWQYGFCVVLRKPGTRRGRSRGEEGFGALRSQPRDGAGRYGDWVCHDWDQGINRKLLQVWVWGVRPAPTPCSCSCYCPCRALPEPVWTGSHKCPSPSDV